MIVFGIADRDKNGQQAHLEKVVMDRLRAIREKQFSQTDELRQISQGPPAPNIVEFGNERRIFGEICFGLPFTRQLAQRPPCSRKEVIEHFFNHLQINVRASLHCAHEMQVRIDLDAA